MQRMLPDADSSNFGPLPTVGFRRDTEIIRILLNAGADPNLNRFDTPESLLNALEFYYGFEVWNMHGPQRSPEQRGIDAWLAWLDEQAIEQGKERATYVRLLRDRRAKTILSDEIT